MSDPIRVLIVDDHPLVRQGLAQLLEAESDLAVVGQASNGQEAWDQARLLRPDIVLMDIDMPGMDGVAATQHIKQDCPETGVIMLTIYRDERHLFGAMKAGAKGYLLKEQADAQELVQTIRTVHGGEAVLDPGMARKMLEEFERLKGGDYIHLTERERDILRLVGQGANNHEIAQQLGIAEKTVRNRLSVIFDKLHINNRTQAALFALREGLTPDATQPKQ